MKYLFVQPLAHTHTKEQPDALLLHIEIDRANEEKNFHLIHEEQWHKMPATRIKSIFKLCEELWTWDTTQREWTAWARKMLCAADESMRLWQMKAGNMNFIRWKRETVRWETELAMKTHFCSAVFAYFNIFILFSFSHFNWTFSFEFFLSFSLGLPCENFFAKQQQHLFIFLCTKLRLYRRGSSFFFRHNSSVMRRNCGSFISATDAPGILLLSVYFTFHSLFWLDFSRFSAFYSICYAQCALIPSDYIKINGSIKSCVCLSWQRVTAFFSRYTQQSDGKASTKQPGSGGSCRSNHSHWDW